MEWNPGDRFVFTGTCASMTRSAISAEARLRGFTVTQDVSGITQVVVLGERWPLRQRQHDIDLTRKTKRAQLLRQRGRPVQIISESDFLTAIQRARRAEAAVWFHAADVVRYTGITRGELKWLEREGILPKPHGDELPDYSFLQFRAAVEFCRQFQNPSPKIDAEWEAIDRALVKLKAILPYARQALETRRSAGALRRRTSQKKQSVPGQLLLDFDDHLTFPELTPMQIFEAAWEAELRDDTLTAIAHYEELLQRPDYHARTEVEYNLANNHYRLADYDKAEDGYRKVVEKKPEFAEAWNNLGLCLCKNPASRSEAVEAFQKALELDPHFADVHFSLAQTLDQLGRTKEAAGHWRAYLRFDKDSEFAEYAVTRLREICWAPVPHQTGHVEKPDRETADRALAAMGETGSPRLLQPGW